MSRLRKSKSREEVLYDASLTDVTLSQKPLENVREKAVPMLQGEHEVRLRVSAGRGVNAEGRF